MTETQEYTVVDPTADPAAAQAVLNRVLGQSSVPTGPEPLPKIRPAQDRTVSLPGGFFTTEGVLVNEGEVRELNGLDEEALARSTSVPKFIDTLLNRGVVRVGEEKATSGLLAKMLAGDLDALLLGIRIATFGPDFEFESITCPHCETVEKDVKIDLTQVPVKRLEDADDREFTVTLKSGKNVLVNLPDGAAQKALGAATDRTLAALNTLLLSLCVQEIDDLPVAGADAVRALGIVDRRQIIEEIDKRNPGPRLAEVSRSCNECSREIPLPLALTDLFPI